MSESESQLLEQIRKDDRFRCFNDYGVINVGITTGNNKFFSITSETEEKYDLSDVVIPLIGRSSHAHGIYFTKDDWIENCNSVNSAQKLH